MAITDFFSTEMNQTASVSRPTQAINAYGEPTTSYSSIGSYKGFLYQTRANEALRNERIKPNENYTFISATTANISVGDILTVNSIRYEVYGTENVALQGEAIVTTLRILA